eukprot:956333_1
MSSWERSRYIPWSRIPDVTGTEYDSSKERVYRLLAKEANEEKARLENKKKGIEETPTLTGFVPPEMQDQIGSGAAGTITPKKKRIAPGSRLQYTRLVAFCRIRVLHWCHYWSSLWIHGWYAIRSRISHS